MAASKPENGVLTRGVLAEYAKERLLQRIMDGSYPPDSRIVETRVAWEFGTSQAPIREALRGLEALGVVEITPFRGTRVRQPDLHELVEAYVVRTDLEVLGARLGMSRITATDLDDLCDLVKQMRDAAAIGDRHAVATADAGFHRRLIQLAGNSTLERLWGSLEPFSRTYITLGRPWVQPGVVGPPARPYPRSPPEARPSGGGTRPAPPFPGRPDHVGPGLGRAAVSRGDKEPGRQRPAGRRAQPRKCAYAFTPRQTLRRLSPPREPGGATADQGYRRPGLTPTRAEGTSSGAYRTGPSAIVRWCTRPVPRRSPHWRGPLQ